MVQRVPLHGTALWIARLYGLTDEPDYPAQVPKGQLATRDDTAPVGENQARQRLHELLRPLAKATADEEMVLKAAEIPLKPRRQGGNHIDPAVDRHIGRRADRNVRNAMLISRLYGLTNEPDYPAVVTPGVLAGTKYHATGWEKHARERLYDLFRSPDRVISNAEEEVLRRAEIPLILRPDGKGYYIDPKVDQEGKSRRVAAAKPRPRRTRASRVQPRSAADMQPMPAVPYASHDAQNPVGEYLMPTAGSGQFSSPQAGYGPGWPHDAPDPQFQGSASPFNPQTYPYGPAGPSGYGDPTVGYVVPGQQQFIGDAGSYSPPAPHAHEPAASPSYHSHAWYVAPSQQFHGGFGSSGSSSPGHGPAK